MRLEITTNQKIKAKPVMGQLPIGDRPDDSSVRSMN